MKIKNSILSSAIIILIGAGCHLNSSRSGALKSTIINDTTTNWTIGPFVKLDSVNPIMQPGKGSFTDPILKKTILWEEKDVFNPAIVNRNGKVYMLYRAQDKTGKPAGTSRIGLAVSEDAIHFTRMAKPVLYPDNDRYKSVEWQGGCEDPRIVEDGSGLYYMTYTAYDGNLARLMVATSPDLKHWTKHGNVFAKAYNGKYADKWAKSGSIVSIYKNGKIVAAKINGKYWMYWGDVQIWAATSDDLINWIPVEMKAGEHAPVPLRGQALNMPNLKIALPTRQGKFDSDLVESGPPAMLTDKGILLLYNSRNVPSFGDKSLTKGTYTAAQVMFNKNNPTQIIHRMEKYFIKPDRAYELSGQVNQVCFIEGLTQFNNNWYLYYGTADSKIAVAMAEVK